MSFTRVGDTFAYDPRTLHPLEYDDADERTVDEVAGFSVRLASQSGAHEHDDTDRRVTRSMALQLANNNPARLRSLMDKLVSAGVWAADGTGWRLVNDPGYLHLLTQDEKVRQRARGADERNPALTVPAKLRDGDNCRYCKKPVNWSDRKSLQGATWEHVDIGVQPTPLHLFVVCCFGCNRAPADRPPLQPPPTRPRYGALTKKHIKDHLGEWPTAARVAELYPGLRAPAEIATDRQRTESEGAATGLRTDSEHAATSQRTTGAHATPERRQRPAITAENASATPASTGPPQRHRASSEAKSSGSVSSRTDPGSHGSGSAGSGRDGSGLLGSPRVSSGPVAATGSSKRSRRAKGRGDAHA